MIRILIEEGCGGAVIVDALVNVSERCVEMLQVETDCDLARVFIAEALVALELEIEMTRRGSDTLLRSREANREQQTEKTPHVVSYEGGGA